MKYYGRYGSLSINMKYPFSKWFLTFRSTNICSDTINWSHMKPICDLLLNWTLLTNLTFNKCFRFPLNIWNWFGMSREDTYSYGHLVPILGLACLPTLRPIHPKLVFFPEFWTSIMLKNSFGDFNLRAKEGQRRNKFRLIGLENT